MHIPDGFLSPAVNLTTGVLSTGAFTGASLRIKQRFESSHAPLLGVIAAFIFAAQMLNFPVAAGTSGHFLGALLAAVLLGPSGAMIVMTVVLLLQALMFADGGVTALGSNVFNMAIIGGWLAYAIFHLLRRIMPNTRSGFLTATGVAAWASVVLASVAASLELALSKTIALHLVLPAMVGIHAVIGVGEALITVAAVSAILAARPDMVRGLPRTLMPAGGEA